LLSRTARAFEVSQRVLWGNVASAAAGAVTVLGSVATADGARARDLVSDLLATGDLRGQGEWTGATYLRFSCCLRYRLPAADLCGDCILLTR